jgi:hypothetical protein
MSLRSPEDFGTTSDGFRQNDDCHCCFTAGSFTRPGIALPRDDRPSGEMVACGPGRAEVEVRSDPEHVLRALRWWRSTNARENWADKRLEV